MSLKTLAACALSALFLCPSPAAAGASRRESQKYYTPDYLALKNKIVEDFKARKPVAHAAAVESPQASYDGQKVIALTFDACRGKHNSYNSGLIEYLRAEKIPATLFMTGIWMDKYPDKVRELARDPLFEIENHGLLHRACSASGVEKYGVETVSEIGDMVDEMELGARKIFELTGRRPVFYRPAAAYTDSICAEVAQKLGMEVITYSLLSGDATPRVSAKVIRDIIIKRARPGAVVIMHFNRPEWHELEALKEAVPILRAKGYSFGRLEDFTLKSN